MFSSAAQVFSIYSVELRPHSSKFHRNGVEGKSRREWLQKYKAIKKFGWSSIFHNTHELIDGPLRCCWSCGFALFVGRHNILGLFYLLHTVLHQNGIGATLMAAFFDYPSF